MADTGLRATLRGALLHYRAWWLVILALLCWAAVTANCEGGGESTIRYQHLIAYQSIIGSVACGELPEYGGCPVYAWSPWTLAGSGSDPCVLAPVPRAGECVFLLTTAYDEADNADCGN